MQDLETLDYYFDFLLLQISKGVTHEIMEQGIYWGGFQQVSEWKNKFGFKFNVFPNDHLIDGKPHFHFDHLADGISCKFDFDGNLLESKTSNPVPASVLKELKYFLSKQGGRERVEKLWTKLNPTV